MLKFLIPIAAILFALGCYKNKRLLTITCNIAKITAILFAWVIFNLFFAAMPVFIAFGLGPTYEQELFLGAITFSTATIASGFYCYAVGILKIQDIVIRMCALLPVAAICIFAIYILSFLHADSTIYDIISFGASKYNFSIYAIITASIASVILNYEAILGILLIGFGDSMLNSFNNAKKIVSEAKDSN